MSADIFQFAVTNMREQARALLEESSEVLVRVPPLGERERLKLVRANMLDIAYQKQAEWQRLKVEADDAFEQAARIQEQLEVA